MSGGPISEEFAEELVSTLRTAVGDELRSATYFTRDAYEQVYIRDDLEQSANMAAFVANERLGFQSDQTYGDTELGDYLFTVRAFEYGYLTRAIVGDHGAFVTTDELQVDRFEEVASALREVLREHADEAAAP
ncbi:hypothetical protein BRC81_15595 [Halobacteriales archaeon QS_1_68_20]|nr:MAG: hypothetical protein BRC81_15595 [Halobacteriales archaeon QS_1_68_20]